MAPTAQISIIGTESFWNNYSSSSPSSKLHSIGNYCENVWNVEIDQGDYPLTTHPQTGASKIAVPESALPSTNLPDRMHTADEWIVANHPLKVYTEGIIVADHFGQDANHYGHGYVGAGSQRQDKSVIADCAWEDAGSLPPSIDQDGSEGIAWHELCHLWNGIHSKASNYSDGDSSVLAAFEDQVDCLDQSSGWNVLSEVSSCNRERIRNYYDDHQYKF